MCASQRGSDPFFGIGNPFRVTPIRRAPESACAQLSCLLFLRAGGAHHGSSACTGFFEKGISAVRSRPCPPLDGTGDCIGLPHGPPHTAKTIPSFRRSNTAGIPAPSPPRQGSASAAPGVRPGKCYGHCRPLRLQSRGSLRGTIPEALRGDTVGYAMPEPKRSHGQRSAVTDVNDGGRAARDRRTAIRPDRPRCGSRRGPRGRNRGRAYAGTVDRGGDARQRSLPPSRYGARRWHRAPPHQGRPRRRAGRPISLGRPLGWQLQRPVRVRGASCYAHRCSDPAIGA